MTEQDLRERLAASEARCASLSEALREIAEMSNSGYQSVSAGHFGYAQRRARAALAALPCTGDTE